MLPLVIVLGNAEESRLAWYAYHDEHDGFNLPVRSGYRLAVRRLYRLLQYELSVLASGLSAVAWRGSLSGGEQCARLMGFMLGRGEMPLHVYPDVYASGSVPVGWVPSKAGTLKYPVRNRAVLRYLRQLLPGTWQKVIKKGNIGEVHYFEHASGQFAGVKFFPD